MMQNVQTLVMCVTLYCSGMSHLFKHTHTLLYMPSYLAAGLFFVELVCPSMWVFPALR